MNPVFALTTFIGYFVIVTFLSIERNLRKGEEAKSFEAGQFDRRSTMFVGMAYAISILVLLLALLLDWLTIGTLFTWVGWFGIGFALLGLLLRRWANLILGAFYTRTLKVAENQTIVRDGPYRFVRHPGYLGSILMWVGASIATANWIVILIVLTTMLAAYHYRMESEEAMLLKTQNDYFEYCKHTWRLIPLIY